MHVILTPHPLHDREITMFCCCCFLWGAGVCKMYNTCAGGLWQKAERVAAVLTGDVTSASSSAARRLLMPSIYSPESWLNLTSASGSRHTCVREDPVLRQTGHSLLEKWTAQIVLLAIKRARHAS